MVSWGSLLRYIKVGGTESNKQRPVEDETMIEWPLSRSGSEVFKDDSATSDSDPEVLPSNSGALVNNPRVLRGNFEDPRGNYDEDSSVALSPDCGSACSLPRNKDEPLDSVRSRVVERAAATEAEALVTNASRGPHAKRAPPETTETHSQSPSASAVSAPNPASPWSRYEMSLQGRIFASDVWAVGKRYSRFIQT